MTDAAGNQEEFLSMGVDQAQYEALERDFRDVLSAMVGEKSMERFRTEYEKLHRALKKSHESEKRLIKKCRELNQVRCLGGAGTMSNARPRATWHALLHHHYLRTATAPRGTRR